MSSMLHELIQEPLEPCPGDPEACLARARRLAESYRLLERENSDAGKILEFKFASLYWRRRLLSHLLDDPAPWLDSDHNILADLVDAMGVRLPASLITRLSGRLKPDTFHYLLARQGTPSGHHPELDRLAGPGVNLNIRANRDSPWPFERWKEEPAFGNYDFSGDGVNFRGIHFRPGDILLANVNLDGNGVYTVLSDPVRFSSHAAVFVVLEDGGRRYPAVIETYEKGVRAVPLNVFLGEGFCAYVEVYRHRDISESHSRRLGEAALDLMRRARGYNFNSVSDDRDYVSCCSVGRLLHADAGLEPASPRSQIQHPRIRDNLERLGYRFFDFFAPVDYLLNGSFQCVGWVDNAQFEELLARELVEGRFRDLFMSHALNPRKMPIMGRVNHWGIRQIRRRTLMGRLIGRFEGFDHASLPRGPDPLMAVIVLVEKQLGRAIRKTRRWLGATGHVEAFSSLAEFSRQPPVREHLDRTLRIRWLE